ncbi:MAG TPA: BtpA/SgcQ family protein [Gaiellaceae bacterium]|nr:BtpA/SgcQ family protein [Gaiellaceae bacterium]
MSFSDLFGEKPILGMIHLPALPGAPRSSLTLDEVVTFALEELERLETAGIDGVIVENVGDTPFFREGVPPVTVAAMGVIVREVVRASSVPVGVNMLRNAWEEAVSTAYVAGGDFIRCNVVIGAYVTDQGIIQGCAAELARLRKSLDRDVLVLGDVHVKHAAPLFDVPLVDAARDLAERGGVDAVIVSGARSPDPPSFEMVSSVVEAVELPVLIGSGIGEANAREFYELSGGILLGEVDFKVGRVWGGASDQAAYARTIAACQS